MSENVHTRTDAIALSDGIGHRSTKAMESVIQSRFEKSIRAPESFFTKEAESIPRACWQMAKRFHQGGRLLAFGAGAFATDAQHVSVEFVHPVIVGKRALPAIALTSDSAITTFSGSDVQKQNDVFAAQIRLLAKEQDIAIGFSEGGHDVAVTSGLHEAKINGLLTLGLVGGDGGHLAQEGLDFCFVVPETDPFVIQEIHETLYHILWELVHVFFEHEGLLIDD